MFKAVAVSAEDIAESARKEVRCQNSFCYTIELVIFLVEMFITTPQTLAHASLPLHWPDVAVC
jgi:hypothetical protein